MFGRVRLMFGWYQQLMKILQSIKKGFFIKQTIILFVLNDWMCFKAHVLIKIHHSLAKKAMTVVEKLYISLIFSVYKKCAIINTVASL